MSIDRLVLHPMNPNRLSPDYYTKLRRNIQETGKYPALIVRNLQKSAKYGPQTPYFERAGGQNALQVLDGEHRLKILRSLGFREVLVDNWGDVDDTAAIRLLTTLNRLRGKDDSRKRATLLALLRSDYHDDSLLAEYLPENADDLARKTQAMETPAVTETNIDDVAGDFDPFTPILDDELERVIQAAIKLRRSRGNLPGRELDPEAFMTIYGSYQKARALAAICEDYILRETK